MPQNQCPEERERYEKKKQEDQPSHTCVPFLVDESFHAWIRGGLLHVRLSHCPADTVITLWYEGKLIRRLEPSCNHFTMSLAQVAPLPRPGLPTLNRSRIELCFSAPGYRFQSTRPKIDWPPLP